VAITQCNTGDARRVANESGESDGADCARSHAQSGRSSGLSYWSDYSLIPCLDGRSRRVEPGSFPLAHGVPNRVGRLRAYGNAIVPACAAAFVTAYLETER
jgi:DNA (cytosine-5)-methyltransferase 1